MGTPTGRDHMLEHIVALLAAMALQAERAAVCSFPVRWLVLTILRRAELTTCAHLAQVTGYEWPCFEDPTELHCNPADAIHLAARFRMLAAVLASLLWASRGYPGRRIDRWHRLKSCALRPAVIPAGWSLGPNDTS